MRNLFPKPPGTTDEQWIKTLFERREAVSAALDGGNQTHLGIAPGLFHEFATMKPADLRRRLDEYDYALWSLDPDTYENPNAGRVMKITTVYE